MQQDIDTLGLIAGSRSLPLEFVRLARRAGVQRLFAVAFEGETRPELADLVDGITWIRVGQLNRLIRAFRQYGVRQCVMLGQIAPKNLFELRLDLRAARLLWNLKERNAHTLFGAIADELAREGITLIEPLPWLDPLFAKRGFHLGPRLSKAQQEDLAFGFRIAKEVSRLDIGQTVVVKNGTVLAVEGFEGTDACLERGGALAGKRGGAVAVKVAKPEHDMRFDIPCAGPQTIDTCARAGIAVMGLEPDRTLVLEQEQTAALARRHRVALTVVEPEPTEATSET